MGCRAARGRLGLRSRLPLLLRRGRGRRNRLGLRNWLNLPNWHSLPGAFSLCPSDLFRRNGRELRGRLRRMHKIARGRRRRGP